MAPLNARNDAGNPPAAPAPGNVDVPARGLPKHGRPIAQPRVEQFHGVRVSSFLRAEDVRCAVASEQRVLDVHGDPELDGGEPGIQSGNVNGHNVGQGSAAQGDHVSGSVHRLQAERTQGAAAAVGHGRSAHAQHDFRGPGVQCGCDQLPAAVAVRAQRVSGRRLHMRQAGGLGSFNDGCCAAEGVLADGPGRTDRRQDGTDDGVEPLLVTGGDGGLEGAFAAVGYRKLGGHGVRIDAQRPFCDGAGGLGRGQ